MGQYSIGSGTQYTNTHTDCNESHLAGVGEIGRALETDREGGREGTALGLAHLDDDGGNKGRVEASGKEHTIRN
jgi:hypothetical protein